MLVVRDPPGSSDLFIPGVLGMNVFSRCYQELFGQHGVDLFDLPAVSQVPSSIMHALQHCRQVNTQFSVDRAGVWMRTVTAMVGAHTTLVGPTAREQINSVDLSVLSGEEQAQVRALLHKYPFVFSAHEGDLGCTNLLLHDIPL